MKKANGYASVLIKYAPMILPVSVLVVGYGIVQHIMKTAETASLIVIGMALAALVIKATETNNRIYTLMGAVLGLGLAFFLVGNSGAHGQMYLLIHLIASFYLGSTVVFVVLRKKCLKLIEE